MRDLERVYAGRRVLITGGLGFIGSNLATKLVGLGAEVTIVDKREYFENVRHMNGHLNIVRGDIGDVESVKACVAGQQIIFDLAEVIDQRPLSNPLSGKDATEIASSVACHRNVAEVALASPEKPRVVYPSSKVVYGDIDESQLPVVEETGHNPLSVYARIKVDSEEMFREARARGLDNVIVRPTVPFGPRSQIKHPGFGVVGWFVRQALENGEVKVYGSGGQIGEYIYIGDVVDAFLLAGVHPKARGKVYNVGSGVPIRFVDMANEIVAVAGSGRVVHVPTPDEIKRIGKGGSFYADVTKLQSLGWRCSDTFRSGIEQTIAFYRENLARYTA